MTLLLPGSLPYLFSPHGCAGVVEGGLLVNRVGRFLDAFEALPARGTLRFPEAVGTGPQYEVSSGFLTERDGPALARSAKVLVQSVHELLRERKIESEMALPSQSSWWRLFNFTSLGAFQNEAGGVALEGALGRMVEVGRENPGQPWTIDVGWRSAVSTVAQSVRVFPEASSAPRVSYFVEFIDLGVAALRKFLCLQQDALEDVLRYLAYNLTRSGLFPQAEFKDHDLYQETNGGLDVWTLQFPGMVDIELSASSHERALGEDGPDEVEEISMNLRLPAESAFRALGPHLEPLWNFGEAVAAHAGDPFGPTFPEN